MMVILESECFDEELEDVPYEEMVFDTRDWFLRKYEGMYVLESLHTPALEFHLTAVGYAMVKSAMVRGE